MTNNSTNNQYPEHNFIIADTALDLWRGDINYNIASSVRCVQGIIG